MLPSTTCSGFPNNSNSTFDGAQTTFPKLLQKAGYQTAIVGKWHLGSDPTGFDFWQILPGQGVYYNPPMLKMGERVTVPGYVTDIIGDVSLEWLQKRDEAKVLSVDLTRALRFALGRKLNVLGEKKPSSGYMRQAAFIDYCYNIAVLAADYTEQLQAVGFDISRLDGACDAAEHLSVLLARVNAERGVQYILRDQRNRAYTHLKEAVDQIRRCGKFAFASQPERLKGYASAYGRKNRK